MADYSPLHKGLSFTRQTSGSVTGGQLVRVSGSGTVAAVTAASADWLGVAAFDAASGDYLTIECDGVQRLISTGSITAGANVEGATAGTVAAHTNGTNDANIVGIALTTVTTGQSVEVKFIR